MLEFKNAMKKFIIFFLLIYWFSLSFSQSLNVSVDGKDQTLNAITTAVPYLLLNPNAQSRGFGDIGVVSSSQYYESGLIYNPALLAKGEKIFLSKFSYQALFRNVVNDIYAIDFATIFSINEKQTIAISYNYFSIGDVTYINPQTYQTYFVGKPKEYYINIKYAKKINEHISFGIGSKYIYSNLGPFYPKIDTDCIGKSIAADLGLNYNNEIFKTENKALTYSIGTSIINIGNKIRYTNNSDADFIPTTLLAGILCSYEKKSNDNLLINFDFAYQLQKLLVPTPPIYYSDSLDNENNLVIKYGKDPNVSVAKGIIQSFYDAPGGFSEEIHEIIHQFGFENRYTIHKDFRFALRLGYFNEHSTKGNRKSLTQGIGLSYKYLSVDFAKNLFGNEYKINNWIVSLSCKLNI